MPEYIDKLSAVNRLIDLENEFQQYKPFHGFEHAMYRKLCEAEIAIGKTPAADVAPVRHEKWLHIHQAVVDTTGDCSACDTEAVWRTRNKPYGICPNCGAKMDLEG